jgi:DNA end-binding protein Ku
MANPRPIWRGHLRIALVSCPVALYSTLRGAGGLHFHLINPKTGHRVSMMSQDSETNEEVSRADLVKGFEFEKDRYVLLDDADFEQARIESSSTLTVGKFVDVGSIQPVFFDSSYYLAADGDAGEDVFVVLRDAFNQTGSAALSRIVIARREHPVAILPFGDGLICHTLHQPSDLHDAKPLFESVEGLKPDPDMVQLAKQLIERQKGKFQPDDTQDHYEARLRDVIEAKLKGEGISPEQPSEPDRGNVIDLMAALKSSLGQQATPAPKKAAPARKATAVPKKQARKRAS